jgi:hypothetical protein
VPNPRSGKARQQSSRHRSGRAAPSAHEVMYPAFTRMFTTIGSCRPAKSSFTFRLNGANLRLNPTVKNGRRPFSPSARQAQLPLPVARGSQPEAFQRTPLCDSRAPQPRIAHSFRGGKARKPGQYLCPGSARTGRAPSRFQARPKPGFLPRLKAAGQLESPRLMIGHPELAKDPARIAYGPSQRLWRCARDPFDFAQASSSGLKSLRMTPVSVDSFRLSHNQIRRSLVCFGLKPV